MKIVFIDVYNPLPINSGGDWYRFQLFSELGRKNELIEYYTVECKNKKGYEPKIISFSVQYIDSIIPWHKLSKKLEILKPETLINHTRFKDLKADVIFFSTVCYHIAYILAKRNRIPLVLVMHNIEWEYLKGNGSLLYIPMRIYEKYIYKQVDAIITLSPKDYKYVSEIVPKEKIFYIPPKIDINIFNDYGDSYNFGSDKFNLLFYGSLDREQNIAGIEFVINQLIPDLKSQKLLEKIRINVFGSGNPPKCLMDAAEVNYLGVVSDPGLYIRGADAIIVPLKNGGGVKIRILESLYCGKPVIATPEAILGLPDELKETVFLASNSKEFVKAIRLCMSNTNSKQIDLDKIDKYLNNNEINNIFKYLNLLQA